MARLLLKLHGEEVSRLTLESGVEYVAGRSQDAQIQLANERGISRHHLKFYEQDGHWVCESLSKFVLIQKGGSSVEVLPLTEACVFSVPPYEFYFEPTPPPSAEKSDADAPAPAENLPAFYQPRTNSAPPAQSSAPMDENTSPGSNNEATQAGVASNLVPYFKISYPNTADDEIIKLEGHLWTAGRDHDCEIPIESPHVSRKHFELARTQEGFFLTDLGSSNGTKVNGQRIPPHEPTRIESGDEIEIKSVNMSFEIRDTHFAGRMDALPVPAFNPMPAMPPAQWYPQDHHNYPIQYQGEEPTPNEMPGLKDWKSIRWHHIKAMGPKKLIVRGTLGIIALFVILLAMTPTKPKPAPDRAPTSAGSNSASFEHLTNEQRSVVKDSFNLARNLYVQGKYELCLTELAKVHELIPQFENSKELLSFCDQGRELVKRQRDIERKERERAMIEQQISGYIEACRSKLTNTASVEETRLCLSEAMELDPEHHLIIEMLHTAQVHAEEQKLLDGQRKAQQAKIAAGRAHLAKAAEIYKKGLLAKAVNEYERYVKTPYPNSDSDKAGAKRTIASIRQELQVKVSTLVDQCKVLGSKGKYRDAYVACEKAVAEDPENNGAKEMRTQMLSQLKSELKGIYEDSVLEESLGNVDTAKEKWKRILKEDIDGGDYAQKAHGKLQKYGVGM